MYKILAFDNGQPAILYHSGHNVYMYTAIRGHIHPEGIIFNDVKDDFRIYDGNKKYAFYISTDNKIKTATLSGNRFIHSFRRQQKRAYYCKCFTYNVRK